MRFIDAISGKLLTTIDIWRVNYSQVITCFSSLVLELKFIFSTIFLLLVPSTLSKTKIKKKIETRTITTIFQLGTKTRTYHKRFLILELELELKVIFPV
jgi:hypothetical protein